MSKQVCPHCHTEQHLKHHKAGQRVRCIQCHRSFCVVLEPRPFFEPGDPMLASAGPPGIPPMFPLPSMNAISMQLLRRIQRPKPQNPKRTPSANVLIEGYEIHECLGRGGMGQVFRAIQKSLGRQVAIKMLDLQLARNKASIMRFTKEAAAMAHLSHPNIVYVLDRGSVRNRYYFIMEYINGPSLRDLVQEGALALCDALEIMLSLAQTMDYAHCTGVIHRDLKPENILFSQLGHLKVADFGLAGMNQETTYIRKLTKSFVSMGTECYMAPEQQRDAKNVDHRADIYSMGVMLYELVTGRLPFPHLPSPNQMIVPSAPKIDQIIRRSMATSPLKRFDTTKAFCKALLEAKQALALKSLDTVIDHHAVESALKTEAVSIPPHLSSYTSDASERTDANERWFSWLGMSPQQKMSVGILSLLSVAVLLFFLLSPEPPHLFTEDGKKVMIPWFKQKAKRIGRAKGISELHFSFAPKPMQDAWSGYPRKQWHIKGNWKAKQNGLEQNTYANGLHRNVGPRWALYRGHALAHSPLRLVAQAVFLPASLSQTPQKTVLAQSMHTQRRLSHALSNVLKKRNPALGIGLKGAQGLQIQLSVHHRNNQLYTQMSIRVPSPLSNTPPLRKHSKRLPLKVSTQQPVQLQLTFEGKKLLAKANGKHIHTLALSLPPQRLYAGLFCRDAHCRFTKLKLQGFPHAR